MPTAENEKRLDDGFSTLITLENIPDIKLYEKEVTPPSLGNGGPIDTTTMRNIALRTAAPKRLKQLGAVSATCAYATDAIEVLYAQLGVNQRITITYPDGSRFRYWGWLDAFTPGANKEGDQPTAEVTFQPSNRDNNGVERAPEYHDPTEATNTQG